MLREVEETGDADIVSFLPHGRTFLVHDVDQFVQKILQTYFKQSVWNSFTRQLSLYGFRRITSGPDSGAYYHELFLRNRKGLSLHMRRAGVPQKEMDRRKQNATKMISQADTTPDFYSMKTLA
jgi:hypothetical protein